MTDTTQESTRLWTANLQALAAVLKREARERPGKWAWRRLPRGAAVACRIHPEYRVLQFRIAREKKPTLRGRELWQRELTVFQQHLGLTGWAQTESDTDEGGVAAFFLAPDTLREETRG